MSDPRANDDTQPIAPPRPLAAAGASAAAVEPQARAATERPSTEPAPSRTADLAYPDQDGASSGGRSATQVVQATPSPAQHSDQPAARTPPPARPPGRKARLRLVRVDPWSVMKMALALSIALAIVFIVAVVIVWLVLSAAGVWDAINDSISAVLDGDTNGFDVEDYVSLERVAGVALVLAALNVVLMTTLATLGAFLYNLSSSLLGGLEVTLAEDR
jgi:hypothetical protein